MDVVPNPVSVSPSALLFSGHWQNRAIVRPRMCPTQVPAPSTARYPMVPEEVSQESWEQWTGI